MKVLIFALLFVIVGCASTSKPIVYADTMAIIAEAADNAPNGIYGEYTFKIKASGKQRNIVYLNTELDYRDQRNLTVALHPKILAELESKYGDIPQDFFVGKTVSVKGYAKRVKINFIAAGGRASNKYYYQTHIRISDISEIEVVLENV